MDRLRHDGRSTSRRYDLLGNSLVLVAPKQRNTGDAQEDVDLLSKLGRDNYMAMANTDAVPAGIYGAQCTEYLGVWKQVGPCCAGRRRARRTALVDHAANRRWASLYVSDAVADRRRARGRYVSREQP